MKHLIVSLAVCLWPMLAQAQTAPAAPGYNLKSLGAALNGASSDLNSIQMIYDHLPDGAAVAIPNGSAWNGTILKPDPGKAVTWQFDGTTASLNYGIAAAGDGDLTEFHSPGTMNFQKKSIKSTDFTYPLSVAFLNFDAALAARGVGQQLSALNVNGISGPTAGGSTGGAVLNVYSYGMVGYGANDIPLNISVFKYGQNPTWGAVIQSNDLSGRLPGSFAGWVTELDGVGNGHDASPMDPLHDTPGVGARVFAQSVIRTFAWPGWTADAQVQAKGTAYDDLHKPSVIKVTAGNGVKYTWYCSRSGKTGGTQPHWAAPAVFTGAMQGGVLTVSAMQDGSPAIEPNQVVTGNSFIKPVVILGQLSGPAGGAGRYAVSYKGSAATAGMYAAAPVADGSATWSFGTEYAYNMKSAFFVDAATPDASVDTVFGASVATNNAVLDTTQAKLGPTAAAIRLAPDQAIDFSGGNKAAERNRRKLVYSTYQGGDYLAYAVAGKGAVFGAYDDGAFKTLRNTLDDGSGNMKITGATVNAGVQIVAVSGAVPAGKNTALVTSDQAVTITMPPAPANPSGTLQAFDVVFAVANPDIGWALGSGRQHFAGAPLPRSVGAGAVVHFLWCADMASWIHTASA